MNTKSSQTQTQSDSLLSFDYFPGAIDFEGCEDLLHSGDLILRTNKDLIVLKIVTELFCFAIELLLMDKNTESSWHTCSCFLSWILLAVWFWKFVEGLNEPIDFVSSNIWFEGTFSFIIISTCCRGSCSSKLFTSEEVVDIFFKFSRSWMSDENNLSFCIDKSNMRNTLDTEFFVSNTLSISDMVVLDCCPSFSFNVTLDLISSLVNWKTNESDLIAPLLFVFFEHFLVMSHWSLAWWTPCGPEVKKNDLAGFMLDNSITSI